MSNISDPLLLITRIKLWCRKYPFVYIPYAKTFCNPSLKARLDELLDGNHDIFIGGYGGSGNGFLYHLLRTVNQELKLYHHGHAPATITIALKRNIPVVIVIRDPLDAISSVVLRFNTGVQSSILSYISFYKFIYKTIQHRSLLLLDFSGLTENTDSALKRIRHFTGIDFNWDDIRKVQNEAIASVEQRTEKILGSKTFNTPDANRTILKERVKLSIRQFPKYQEAKFIHKSLWEHANRKN